MEKPIIDPSTLSQEQRKAILEIWRTSASDFKAAFAENPTYAIGLASGCSLAVVEIFGKDLFENRNYERTDKKGH